MFTNEYKKSAQDLSNVLETSSRNRRLPAVEKIRSYVGPSNLRCGTVALEMQKPARAGCIHANVPLL